MRCDDCGHCCVIFTLIPVDEIETKINGYKAEQKENKKGKMELCLKRKKVYWGEIGKEVFMCVYFDIDRKLCAIYTKRPLVCMKFHCDDGWPVVNSEWLKLMSNGEPSCLRL